MMQILKYLIFGHVHHWVAKDEVVRRTRSVGFDATVVISKNCECSKCGAWRRFDLL